nr:NADH dehydrogenase subunit 5 [Chloeia pocicola]
MKLPSISLLTSWMLWLAASLMLTPALFFLSSNLSILLEWEVSTFNSPIYFTVILDSYSTLFSFTVLFISANVMMFAATYMGTDPFIHRFTMMVILFILSMNLLIFIPHMIILLLGWDGLGITSFVLVIYYQNPKSLAAGMITALSNRIGDVLILISIAWSLNQGHWIITNMTLNSFSSLIILFITIAAMTKSAQIPFSSWLPAAMAAPTPVSALVHSSTLVTAGVFLLIRFYPFLSSHPLFNPMLLFIATLTMTMAGIAATMETDLKKIIALSTLSQLGVMMAALGLNLPMLAFFHLMTHALFKALLFVCAGSVIHFHDHDQDLRATGNISLSNPLLTSCMTIANLALCGTPFLAGFYSKDLILEISAFNPSNLIILIMFFIATGLTAGYSVRFSINLLWNERKSPPLSQSSDEDTNLTLPLMFLTLGAITGGALLNWIYISPLAHPMISPSLKALPLIATLLGAWLAFHASNSLSSSINPFYIPSWLMFSSVKMWFLTPLSTQAMLKLPFYISHQSLKSLDQGWSEALGSQGTKMMLSYSASNIQPWQSNSPTKQLSTTFFILLPCLIVILL